MTRRLTLTAVITLALLGVMTAPVAAVTGPTTLFAAHPAVMAQPEVGRAIDDMAVKGGRLYLGYGDYTANTGPIAVAWVELATGATGVSATAPTEEINTYRTYGGNLFAPWVDPTGWGGAVNGGFTTDAGGWHNVFTTPAGHVFDYAELGGSRFLAGAVAYGGAGVWQSDGGGPWQLVREEESPGGATGWERFYWAVVLRGKLYVQAKHNGGTEAQPSGAMFPLRSYDGTQWRTLRASVDGITAGHSIEVFRDRAYYRASMFDGSRTRRSDVPVPFVRDWFTAAGYLYAVGGDGTLARTAGNTWQALGRVVLPSGVSATSVAVAGSDVFVGTSAGTVLHSTL